MIVKSATGPVDLSNPENIRRGMAFRSPHGEAVVVTEPLFPGEKWNIWRTSRDGSINLGDEMYPYTFLGCDPARTTRGDCERFGLAPGIDAGAHGFARTREGFAVDLRRERLPIGSRVRGVERERTLTTSRWLLTTERFIGLDMRLARAEDVERLCCCHRDPRGYLCSLALGEHEQHEDIAAGAKWPAERPIDRAVPYPSTLTGPAPSLAEGIAVWRGRAATPGTAERLQIEAIDAELQKWAGDCGSGTASVKAALDKITGPTWTTTATGYETTVRGYKVTVKRDGGPWRYEVSDWAGAVIRQRATEREAKEHALRVVPGQPSSSPMFGPCAAAPGFKVSTGWADAPAWADASGVVSAPDLNAIPETLTFTRAADIPAATTWSVVAFEEAYPPPLNLTPQAAALRSAMATIDALPWAAADKRALRDAAHAVCEMVEATDGKAPARLRGPVTEMLAALATAAHVGPAVVKDAELARGAAALMMPKRRTK